MSKHKFTITIEGSKDEATRKIKAIVKIASKLTTQQAEAFAKVAKNEPEKIALAMSFIGG